MSQHLNDTNRHRDMTEKRKNRRKKIVAAAALSLGIAATAGTMTSCDDAAAIVSDALNAARQASQPTPTPMPDFWDTLPMILGGAMGQWEEIPLEVC